MEVRKRGDRDPGDRESGVRRSSGRKAEVRELTTTQELAAASALLARIWRPTDPVPFAIIRVISHVGGYVGGAYDGSTLVGASVAYPTAAGGLHSDITGVTVPGRGVGLALKLHQRKWALARGIAAITWTFDPLVRRNAAFNLVKLGARITGYLEDFYGEMPDELNAGDPSDRLLTEWRLGDPAVAEMARSGGAHAASAVARDPAAAGAVPVLDEDAAGRPAERPAAGAAPVAVATPADITALRADRHDVALEWRRAQRAALGGALATGHRVAGFTRSGHYLLATVPGPAGPRQPRTGRS